MARRRSSQSDQALGRNTPILSCFSEEGQGSPSIAPAPMACASSTNAVTNERIRNSELRSLAGLHLLLRVMDENLTDRVAAIQRDESALRELRAQMTSEATALQSLRA